MIYDLIVRDCGKYGYLPLVVEAQSNKELYRGEHQYTPTEALQRAQWAVESIKQEASNA